MNLDAGRRSTDSITWIDNNRDKINSFIGFYTEKLLYYVDKTPNITIPVLLTDKIQNIKDLINDQGSREPIVKIKDEIISLFDIHIKGHIGPESSIFEIIENLQNLDLDNSDSLKSLIDLTCTDLFFYLILKK